jgi:uncharacterized membrane protein YqgA involved in biofilm formation
MLGTIVNFAAIIVGSLIGALFHKGISERFKTITIQIMGLVVVALSVTWIVTNVSETQQPLIFILSLLIGGLIGEALKLEDRVNEFGDYLQEKGGSDNQALEGMVTAALLYCTGAMVVLGPLESALQGVHTILFTKAILDGMMCIILASSYGAVIGLSALPVLIVQGFFYYFASILEPYATPEILGEFTLIGGVLLFTIALSLLDIKKFKTVNLLPALLGPVVYVAVTSML